MVAFSIASNILQGRSAAKAARAQGRAATRSTNEAIRFLEEGRDLAFEKLNPFLERGLAALKDYSTFVRGGEGADEVAKRIGLNSPAMQFRLTEGMDQLNNAASARGGLSGGELKGLERFRQGVATDELDRGLARLAGLASAGQSAAGAQASAATGAGGQIGQVALQGGLAAGEANATAFLNNPLATAFGGVGSFLQGASGTDLSGNTLAAKGLNFFV